MLRGSRGDYPYDQGKHLLVMTELYTYADESGIEDGARFCIVGGYMASPRQWKAFRKDWAAALSEFGFRAGREEFHAKIFFNRQSPYRRWANERCATFLRRLLDVINRRQVVPVAGVVDVAAFNALPLEQRQFETGGIFRTPLEASSHSSPRRFLSTGAPNTPYFCAFGNLIGEVVHKAPPDARLNFVLDRQNIVESRAVETFHEVWKNSLSPADTHNVGFLDEQGIQRMGGLIYEDSTRELALQAADLYCYVWNRFLTRNISSKLLKVAEEGIRRKRATIDVMDSSAFKRSQELEERELADYRSQWKARESS
jgi:Protein of unknown function (DUF3800)